MSLAVAMPLGGGVRPCLLGHIAKDAFTFNGDGVIHLVHRRGAVEDQRRELFDIFAIAILLFKLSLRPESPLLGDEPIIRLSRRSKDVFATRPTNKDEYSDASSANNRRNCSTSSAFPIFCPMIRAVSKRSGPFAAFVSPGHQRQNSLLHPPIAVVHVVELNGDVVAEVPGMLLPNVDAFGGRLQQFILDHRQGGPDGFSPFFSLFRQL